MVFRPGGLISTDFIRRDQGGTFRTPRLLFLRLQFGKPLHEIELIEFGMHKAAERGHPMQVSLNIDEVISHPHNRLVRDHRLGLIVAKEMRERSQHHLILQLIHC